MYNERLYSREGAAELLGISVSTLADYELGNTKVVPVDKVVLMADLYNAPELKTGYCKYECPICSYLPVATEAKGLEGIALRLMKRLDCDELNRIKKELVDISITGIFQCFCIVMACEQRGRVAFGGEYLILPAAILARLWIPEMIQSVSNVLEMPDEEEDDV